MASAAGGPTCGRPASSRSAAGKGVVLAYPDAVGGAWNDGRPGADPIVPGAPIDDGRFLRMLIDETVARTGRTPAASPWSGFRTGR